MTFEILLAGNIDLSSDNGIAWKHSIEFIINYTQNSALAKLFLIACLKQSFLLLI